MSGSTPPPLPLSEREQHILAVRADHRASYYYALFLNVPVIIFSIPFFFVPIGESIRPMTWACGLFVAGGLSLLAAIRDLLILIKYRHKPALLTLLLNLLPYPLGFFIFVLAVQLRDLQVAH